MKNEKYLRRSRTRNPIDLESKQRGSVFAPLLPRQDSEDYCSLDFLTQTSGSTGCENLSCLGLVAVAGRSPSWVVMRLLLQVGGETILSSSPMSLKYRVAIGVFFHNLESKLMVLLCTYGDKLK